MDREDERATLDALLQGARAGLSGATVLRGEPGIGKTALLGYAAKAADGLEVVHVVGVEAESGFAFAALHRLLVPFLDRLERVPRSQRSALEVACGLADGDAADVMLVGLGALSLLAEAAADRPLLLCVDDAQWIDPESLDVFAFLGRRVHAEGIVVLFAVRDGASAGTGVDGLPTVQVEGLDRVSAIELLRSVHTGELDSGVADQVVMSMAGNPLALTDLGRELASYGLAGGVVLPETVPVRGRLEAHYLDQVRALPPSTQVWLLLAAAEPSGDVGYLTAASRTLGLPDDASHEAEVAGVVVVRQRVEFRHPLVRSAVYSGATSPERRGAHRALATAMTRVGDDDRRVWHRAAGAAGPDEDVADTLEGAATQARTRGGFAASSRFLARAAELSVDAAARSRRLLGAAEASLTAGVPIQARALLDQIGPGPFDASIEGRRLLLLADLDITLGEEGAFATAPVRCLEAARAFADHDAERARQAVHQACRAVTTCEHLLPMPLSDIAQAVVDRWGDDDGPVAHRTTLAAFSRIVLEGYVEAVPDVRRAIAALTSPAASDDELLAHVSLGTTLCTVTWAFDQRTRFQERAAATARRLGALRDLDIILFVQSMGATDVGDLRGAEEHLVEGHQLRATLGTTPEMIEIYRHPELLAWQASRDGLKEELAGMIEASRWLGIGATVTIAHHALTILHLGQGRYAEAAAAARAAIDTGWYGMEVRGLPNLVEAATRAGEPDVAEQALHDLGIRARAAGGPLALGIHARSAALVASDGDAEALYRAAIEQLARSSARNELARAHLVFGEWLRRRRRRADARDELRAAHAIFADMGATAFTERARSELAATGERARRRSVETANDLTPQESQIARLAAGGDTNAEIAARLFISARTVDYHLRKVYRKLGVGSRRDLRGMTI